MPRLHVHEGKQHAGLVIELQGLAGDDHLSAAPFRQLQLGLHLRNGGAFAQALLGQVFVLGPFQHIQFIG
ncbi:hypothetical protein D3C87_2028220 [compost metagenome]